MISKKMGEKSWAARFRLRSADAAEGKKEEKKVENKERRRKRRKPATEFSAVDRRAWKVHGVAATL
jgi:hypothetical protein